ncbi:uncharacterized protein LOC126369944 [Pectinophora gossypiella]|uniref:uncharacterized protein LOC126369944 n=1 Tax=Pectinophora gossypiella TaxID=13191 RepID=UPI00214E71C4|nr:uncharacterized protein LOC126369944 [Pectinophora gossypiella]
MPRKNKKLGPKIVNVTQQEKLLKLFDEATDESDVPDENNSDQELEESERSADEEDDSEHSSDVSIHDPFSDGDGEYGSDVDYVPGEEEISTDGSSHGAESESSQVSQSKSNSHKVAKASCQSKDQCSEKPMLQASSSPSSKVPKILTSDPSQHPDKDLMIQPMVSQNKQLQLATNTVVDQLPSTRASSLQIKPMPSPDQPCSSVIEVHASSSKKTTIQEQPTASQNLPVTAIQVDCSPVIQTSTLSEEQMQVQPNQSDLNTQKGCSSPKHISSTQKSPSSQNRLDTDKEIDCSPDTQICSLQQSEARSVQPVNQPECQSVAQSNSSQQRQPTPPANLENEQNLGRPISPNHVSSWEDNTLPITDFQFDDMNSGPTVPLDNNTTPLNVLEYFFTDEMIEFIVSCTNTYGTNLCNSNRPHTRGSRAQSFKPTDAEEMKKFLGLCILQGHLDVPSVRKLFTQSDPLYCYPIFPYTMSGRRFEQLLRCLCVSELNSKGIDKVKAFTKKVIRNFQTLNHPEKELSLDESLMPFRGRLSFRQYIKNKKAKYGIKFYVLTSHDGYTYIEFRYLRR